MARSDAPLSPEELFAKTGCEKTPAETEREIAVRLAALESLDPSQKRPKPSVLPGPAS